MRDFSILGVWKALSQFINPHGLKSHLLSQISANAKFSYLNFKTPDFSNFRLKKVWFSYLHALFTQSGAVCSFPSLTPANPMQSTTLRGGARAGVNQFTTERTQGVILLTQHIIGHAQWCNVYNLLGINVEAHFLVINGHIGFGCRNADFKLGQNYNKSRCKCKLK